ncbi:MMPL family transporter [Actinomadura parmotrematis]|uniref:MMPL family transporter n=1 Tax=Actinomadura parmotrematis TaxID=2864039 RepID=A0ABS7G509_9ACTN|nr:MMPL family transporter [Actinomadura parmotrematis]MBW8487621.1 MMPL family transporter [Actinomadura parmotrematis]
MLRRLLPALLVLVWILGAGPLGQFAGKLGDVASNDSTTFLPASAESTEVAKLQKGFEQSGASPAVIVWETAGPVTAAQRDAAAGALKSLAGSPDARGAASPPIPAPDGRALQAIVPLRADLAEPDQAIDRLRAAARKVPGTTVSITGPAALRADLGGAFAGIDGILLGVALGVVLLILLLVYRSVLLPLVVVFGAVLALGLASAIVYQLAEHGVLDLNGQTQGIMFILVVGAATDYALLLAVRVREELAGGGPAREAVRHAWRRSLAPIAASAGTVAAGLLTLLFSDLNSNRALGPVAAIGVGCALLSALTFLPAALALLGRAAYWPSRDLSRGRGLWERLGALIARAPRRIWIVTAVVLAAFAAFLPLLKADGIAQTDTFLNPEPSVQGQKALARHFPAGSGSPVVIITREGAVQQVAKAVQADPAVSEVRPTMDGDRPKVVDGRVELSATLKVAADGRAAEDAVARLRHDLRAVPGGDVLVGGYTATEYDTLRTAERDRTVIVPIALAVVLLILILLLRALVAPLVLIATVALSYAATLGVAALAFDGPFGFPGSDPVVPLFGFVFLVALGVDYNIFLMTRVREEAAEHGTREGVVRGLVATGGVITSAGVVLAATFGALSVIPLVFLVQISFIVAFGVLLDTLAVRSLLVPALVHDLGDRAWWPGRLARRARPEKEPVDAASGR